VVVGFPGGIIVEAGTTHIRATDADLGIFHCAPQLRDFYAASGWIAMDDATTLVGDKDAPHRSEELMMLFLSPKARRDRDAFARSPLYFGKETW